MPLGESGGASSFAIDFQHGFIQLVVDLAEDGDEALVVDWLFLGGERLAAAELFERGGFGDFRNSVFSRKDGPTEAIRPRDFPNLAIHFPDVVLGATSEAYLRALPERLAKFGLQLAEEKSALVKFNRWEGESSGKRLVHKWLNRRSQRRSYNWTTFDEAWERWKIPSPQIFENHGRRFDKTIRKRWAKNFLVRVSYVIRFSHGPDRNNSRSN